MMLALLAAVVYAELAGETCQPVAEPHGETCTAAQVCRQDSQQLTPTSWLPTHTHAWLTPPSCLDTHTHAWRSPPSCLEPAMICLHGLQDVVLIVDNSWSVRNQPGNPIFDQVS